MFRYDIGWGATLELFEPGEPLPERLVLARSLFDDDPRRVPGILVLGSTSAPVVVCWPPDADVPDPAAPDFDGADLTQPVVLRCFACGAERRGLYPEGRVGDVGPGRNRLVTGCSRCGADFVRSRVQAIALEP